MSKAGAQRASKKREVMALVNEAAEKRLLKETITAQQAELQRQERANVVFWHCRHFVLNGAGGLYSLPAEVLGAEIAESMLRTAYQDMLRRAMEQRASAAEVKPGDIRLASPQ